MSGTSPQPTNHNRLPVGRLVALFLVLSALPLIGLAVSSVHLASDAVGDEVEQRVQSTALLSAAAMERELNGLSELVESYARRPTLITAMESEQRAGHAGLHLRDLKSAHRGIATTFVADMSGRLVAIAPATDSIVGKDFSFRDWYRGVRATGRTYVSEAYRSQATGRPLVVAVATVIRTPADAGAAGRPIGILVAAYSLRALGTFADELATTQGLSLAVTDQRGALVAAAPAPPLRRLDESYRRDPFVSAALRGESGVGRRSISDQDLLVAFAPIGGVRWAAYAVVDTETALAGVGRLRFAVYSATGMLALILLGGVLVLARTLRGRRTAEDAAERSRLEAERAKEAAERAREEAETASRAKSEFLSRMSHELRTPLNSILGFGQLLEMGELDREERESVSQILKGGDHLLGLINEVLDVARIEAGRLSLSVEAVAAGDAVAEVLELIAPIAAERHIELQHALPAEEVFVLADRQRLKQVLLNLLSNAVKYNRKRGSVLLRLMTSADGPARIEVTDTGCGLTPEQVQRLFVPFERLGADCSEVEGTGLGLTLSKGLVDAMGGRLGVDSTVGVGSTFWLELTSVPSPVGRVDDHAESAYEDALAGMNRSRGVVLYIEDNLANVKLIERVLERFDDVELLVAMQGRIGLDLAREHVPDLILLDLHLPDLPGDEVLARLRDDPRTAEIPIVILSADATPTRLERLRDEGADDYLTKPLELQRFFDILNTYLRGRAGGAEDARAATGSGRA
jgi:signal transduction histidine kinase/CheY-like chemotaxis protein